MSYVGPYQVVCDQIGQLIHRHGSLRKTARVLEISPAYLSRLFSGEKDEPSYLLLRKMGLRKIVRYELINPTQLQREISK